MESDNSDDEEFVVNPPNAFDEPMQPPSKKAKVDEVDPIMIAVVYTRRLMWIDPSEPLYGCPYDGQAVRQMDTPEKVAMARWKEENYDAVRKPKRVGLLHELKVHGPAMFVDKIVDSRRGPRSEVQKWADEREIELIAEHGGPLRDPYVRCNQTLNLDHGGKFGMNFESRDALRTVSWLHFQDEMDEYISCYETALVPHSYVSSSGYKLGSRLAGVRQGELWKGHPDQTNRIEWLESLPGWAWNARETDEWLEANSERGTAQWANADKETRAEWSRTTSEAMNRPEVKAANSESGKAQWANADKETRAEWKRNMSEAHSTPEYKAAASERANAQAVREASDGKPSLAERGKATSTANWTKEQREAALAKQVATTDAKRAAVLAGLPESKRPKKQADFDAADRKEANRRGKAEALLQLSTTYADNGYQWCYKNLPQVQKDGVDFSKDERGVWCARAGNQGAGSSAEHARTVVASMAVSTAASMAVSMAVSMAGAMVVS